MMGHPGDEAIMPLAEEATAAGIKMMYQNVDVPTVRARFGGGYVGANLAPQGYALGQEAVRQFGLAAGDVAIVFVPLGQPGRDLRELSTAQALEDAGRQSLTGLAGVGLTEPGAPSLTLHLGQHQTRSFILAANGAVAVYADARQDPGAINIGSHQPANMEVQQRLRAHVDQCPSSRLSPILACAARVTAG
jgi:simple sugar transport system substrate-binding protein